jgi:hypothetical protein
MLGIGTDSRSHGRVDESARTVALAARLPIRSQQAARD